MARPVALSQSGDDPGTLVDEKGTRVTTPAAFDGTATDVPSTPFGTIAATNVQAALEEIVAEATGAGAPTDADYVVLSANATLSAEAVLGTAVIMAGLEAAKPAAATAGRLYFATDGGTAGIVYRDTGAAWVEIARAGDMLTQAEGDARYWQLSTDLATQAELDAHVNDSSAAHAASAISIADAAGDFTATDVEGALAELQADAEADDAALAAHLADTVDAHDASAISYLGATGIAATDVEGALDELAAEKLNTADHDTTDHSTALGTAVLADLSDVAATAPSDGQVLTFDTTNGWQPETPAAGGGGTVTFATLYAFGG